MMSIFDRPFAVVTVPSGCAVMPKSMLIDFAAYSVEPQAKAPKSPLTGVPAKVLIVGKAVFVLESSDFESKSIVTLSVASSPAAISIDIDEMRPPFKR